MNLSQRALLVIGLLCVVIFTYAQYSKRSLNGASTLDENLFPGQKTTNTVVPNYVSVTMTKDGYVPSSVTIKKGQYVSFGSNVESTKHHPIVLPNTTSSLKNALKYVGTIEYKNTIEVQLNSVGELHYANKLNPKEIGVVYVTD